MRLLPVAVDSLDHCAHDLDLYIKYSASPKAALYRGAGVVFSAADAGRLSEQRIRFLYVPSEQHAIYRKALTTRLDRLFTDKALAQAERARIIRESAGKMIEDVLLLPGQPESVGIVQDASAQLAAWAASDPREFSCLLDISAHDLSTAGHMANVGLGCGMLFAELRGGPQSADPAELALYHQGGLLHDIGKRDIPEAVLCKEGKLAEPDWQLVRRHPIVAHLELAKLPGVSPIVLEMARDHHERLDGSGYPAGLTADKLGLPACVCAVVDAFDSITTARPYRPATPPADALKIMADGVGTYFEEEVFAAWRRIIERMLAENPARALPPTESGPTISLADLIPSSELAKPAPSAAGAKGAGGGGGGVSGDAVSGDFQPSTLWQDNRRRHQRVHCEISVEASFVRRLKNDAPAPPKSFPVQVKDISQSGMQVQTPWPLSLNDVLSLRVRKKDGSVTDQRARVVRVRRGPNDTWLAGVCFVASDAGGRATQPAVAPAPTAEATAAPTAPPPDAPTAAPAPPAAEAA